MWFKRRATSDLPIAASEDELARLGRGAYPTAGLPTRTHDLSQYYLPALEACGFPTPAADGWSDFVDRFLSRLIGITDATNDDWALVGAFEVARDLLGSDVSNPRYADLVDRTLRFLRDSGVPHQLVPPFALQRWYDQVGMVRLQPVDWPASTSAGQGS